MRLFRYGLAAAILLLPFCALSTTIAAETPSPDAAEFTADRRSP